MKYLNLSVLFCIGLLLTACLNEEAPTKNCAEEMLKQFQVSIQKEDYPEGCDSEILIYLYKGQQYFLQRSSCSLKLFHPIDCEGEFPESSADFFDKAVEIGVVNIE